MTFKHYFLLARNHFFSHFAFYFCLVFLLLLLLRNPFSQRTLIAAMDPFPDSIHYTNPGFSILKGKGFVLERAGQSVAPDVPPVYTFMLLPFFAIFRDVRAFYFANVLLLIGSYFLFYQIIQRIFRRKEIQFILLFLFATSTIFSWYATLAMAEIPLMFFFLCAVHLLQSKLNYKNIFLMAVVPVCFYATKFASISLTFFFPLIYVYAVIISKNVAQWKVRRVLFFIFSLVVFASIFEVFEYLSKGSSIVTQILPLFLDVFIVHGVRTRPDAPVTQSVFFSTSFLKQNLVGYLSWLCGSQLPMLWKSVQILPPILAVSSCIGLLISVLRKKWRLIGLCLVGSLFAVLGFMMTFYVTDGRYFFTAIPTLLFGLGFILTELHEQITKHFGQLKSVFFLGGVTLYIFVWSFNPVKSAVLLNLRHAETPWMYISILELNKALSLPKFESKTVPYVISPLSPYYMDFFLDRPVKLLPLSNAQEARMNQKIVWGDFDYKDLEGVYASLIKNNQPVFFANYGIGNDPGMQKAERELKNHFKLTEVRSGCADVCKIYKVELKK